MVGHQNLGLTIMVRIHASQYDIRGDVLYGDTLVKIDTI